VPSDLDGEPPQRFRGRGSGQQGLERRFGFNVYCHSSGEGTYATTPVWSSGTITEGECNSCHGNSPTTNAHAAHVVGIHYDNIYNGTSGLATTADPVGDKSHGDGNGTTISCNICHNDTVDVADNAGNDTCLSCHTDGGGNLGDNYAALKTGTTSHINGSVNFAFAAIQVQSKAQLRDASLPASWTRPGTYKATGDYDLSSATLNTVTMKSGSGATTNCTVACHNDNTVQWDATISCMDCHTDLK